MCFCLCCYFGSVFVVFVSNCLIPSSSHKSCGDFQVLVKGHCLCVPSISRLFNLDCRYPRDQLQPARKKKEFVEPKQLEQTRVLGKHARLPLNEALVLSNGLRLLFFLWLRLFAL